MKWKIALSFATVLISVGGSYLIAWITAKKEIQKDLLRYQKEHRDNAFSSFSSLQSAVKAYCQTQTNLYKRRALSALGAFETYADPEMLSVCSALYQALSADDIRTVEDFSLRLSELWQTNQPQIKSDKRKSRKQTRSQAVKNNGWNERS